MSVNNKLHNLEEVSEKQRRDDELDKSDSDKPKIGHKSSIGQKHRHSVSSVTDSAFTLHDNKFAKLSYNSIACPRHSLHVRRFLVIRFQGFRAPIVPMVVGTWARSDISWEYSLA